MIIEWVRGTYHQLRRYIGLEYWGDYSIYTEQVLTKVVKREYVQYISSLKREENIVSSFTRIIRLTSNVDVL